MILPGQQMVPHDLLSTLEPEQPLPPQEGAGLLHLLVQIFVPPPQVLLHDPHVHGLHPPSTINDYIHMLQVQRN